jgi:hypothetical protein
MTTMEKKDKVAEKMAMRSFPHFIHKFMKLFMNQACQFWKFFEDYHEFV